MPRGKYRRYLKDENIPKPVTSRRRDEAAALAPPAYQNVRLMSNSCSIEIILSRAFLNISLNYLFQDALQDDPMVLHDSDSTRSRSPRSADLTSSTSHQTYGTNYSDSHGSEVHSSDGESDYESEECSDSDGNARSHSSGSARESECASSSDSDIESEPEDRGEGGDYFFDEEDEVFHDKPKIYEGCSLTIEQSELLIMSYSLRFGLSDAALESLLKLIDCHLPSPQHESLYLFKQKFPTPPSSVLTKYYCPECKSIVSFENVKRIVCSNNECKHLCVKSVLKRLHCYFLYIPLKEQLIWLLQDKNIHSKLVFGPNASCSDVHNGRIYRRLVETGAISPNDLTLQWNTDGVQIFKSSRISLWPIQVAINNLPFRERNHNIVLCGLWYGSKPEMNTFLEPFVEELNDLHSNGLQYIHPVSNEQVTIKAHVLLASVDSQARPMLQKLKTYRGIQGCSYCLHEGEERSVGRGHARVYRGDVGPLRTHQQHLQDTNTVIATNKVTNGIRGASVLLLLSVFNIISSFVPDYLHCLCLGVVKTTVSWWLQGSNKDETFYLGSPQKMRLIDDVLLSIKPPTEITRTPRSISQWKIWKASEWKNFLLYYSIPCLLNAGMPKKYVEHWFLLVSSMHLLLKEKIRPTDLVNAGKSLREFVLTMEEVYNAPQLMKFNLHLLLHFIKSIKDFAALWAVSCFPYEHYNGVLAKMFRSSQAVPQQICKFYLRLQSLKDKGMEVFPPDTSSYAKTLYEAFSLRKSLSGYCTAYGENVRLFGKPTMIKLSPPEKIAVTNFLAEDIGQDVFSYHRFIFKSKLFHVEGYERMIRRTNNVVLISNGDVITISHAILIKTISTNQTKCILIGKKMYNCNEIFCEYRSLRITSEMFASVMETTPEYVAFFPNMICDKCVVVPKHRNKFYVYPLVNSIERD